MIEVIIGLIFDIVGYGTARLLLPLLSLGQVRAERLEDGEQIGFNWFGIKRNQHGKLICSAESASWIGIGIWIALLVVLLSLV